MSSLVYGSHTEQAYSSDGRTKDLFACSLTLVELMFMFLWRNPSVLLAFDVMLFIRLSHLRSDCIETHRYFICSFIGLVVCLFAVHSCYYVKLYKSTDQNIMGIDVPYQIL